MKKYLIGTIIFFLVFSLPPSFSFQKTQAMADISSVPVAEKLVREKEVGRSIFGFPIPGTGWDSLAWTAASLFIQKIVDSTVDWINNGFNGGPFFVTNFGDFIEDAADQASGLVLEKLKLTGLCYDFAPRLEFNLGAERKTPMEERMRCTISRVIDNIEDFQRDFANGGWAGWIAITAPQNNIYGAYLGVSGEIARAIDKATHEAQTDAEWGKGFLSFKTCVDM